MLDIGWWYGETEIEIPKRGRCKAALIVNPRDTIKTVSYTHLDVYKRQDKL